MARKAKRTADELANEREERRVEQAIEESSYWNAKIAGADNVLQAMAVKRGRPSIYNDKTAEHVCALLAQGLSLHKVCERDDTPGFSTITRWLEENPSFRARYVIAREKQADAIFDECLDIADEAANDILYDDNGQAMLNNVSVQRAKLRIDTRFRIAGKLNSKYADKGAGVADVLNVTHNNLTIDARALDGEQRDKLRSLLLIAKASET
jgi:hypothetical protein